MLLKVEKVFKVLDKEIGEYRLLRYKDIVIFLRVIKNWFESLLEELGKEGIFVYVDMGLGYFELIEIRIIILFLKVIDNLM